MHFRHLALPFAARLSKVFSLRGEQSILDRWYLQPVVTLGIVMVLVPYSYPFVDEFSQSSSPGYFPFDRSK